MATSHRDISFWQLDLRVKTRSILSQETRLMGFGFMLDFDGPFDRFDRGLTALAGPARSIQAAGSLKLSRAPHYPDFI